MGKRSDVLQPKSRGSSLCAEKHAFILPTLLYTHGHTHASPLIPCRVSEEEEPDQKSEEAEFKLPDPMEQGAPVKWLEDALLRGEYK